MKTKNKPQIQANLKLLMVLMLFITVMVIFTSCASRKKSASAHMEIATPPPPPPPPPPPLSPGDEDIPYVVVEEMPMFQGGDSALLAYIAKNTRYPESAKANNIQGRVIVRFCVTKGGGVDRVSILKGVSPDLDLEALRVVETLPEFKPGKQGGKPVSVWYMVPITFALNNSVSKNGANGLPQLPPPPPPPPPPVPSIDEIYTDVDEMPVFEGGDTALLSFVAKKTVYPPEAKLNGIQGIVLVKFVVEKDGTVSNAEIMEGADPVLDEEALKVVKSLPSFAKPGKIGGKNVRVIFMLPISFVLKAF